MSELWQLPLLFATGLVAGFVDSIAGGGGLIALPVLLSLGLDLATRWERINCNPPLGWPARRGISRNSGQSGCVQAALRETL